MSIDKILSRYSTEHADTFRFLPPFIRTKKNWEIYEQVLAYLRVRDPHFRLRSLEDPLEFEPPWYETVCFIVGLTQQDDANYQISSLLVFQTVVGELGVGFAGL